jgi:nicotinamide-nucleotide adenylyltransferase
MRGLFIGRFQPFHKGHLAVIKEMAAQVDKLIIVIGSAQSSHTLKDPFTAGERHLMMTEALDVDKITNYYIIPIMDLNRYKVWVAHVRSHVPPFDVIFTNNELTVTLFSEAGVEVRRPRTAGEQWRSLVPEATARVIDQIRGEHRVKTLAEGGEAS